MSSSITRAFSSAGRAAYRIGGKVGMSEVKVLNGPVKGPNYEQGLDKFAKEKEQEDPRVDHIVIQGALAHQSSNDPSDKEHVITVSVHTKGGTRLGTGHVHEDGTFKYWAK